MKSFISEQIKWSETLTKAVALEIPYYKRPLRQTGQPAAVIALLSLNRLGEDPAFLFIRRTESVDDHKGQMAFPGGRKDPEDFDTRQTALRELEEELGIPPARVHLVGVLPDLWTITNYWITPWLGVLSAPREEVEIKNHPGEIADSYWILIKDLQNPSVYHHEQWSTGGSQAHQVPIHFFQYQDLTIWGATGAMLKNILDRLEKLG